MARWWGFFFSLCVALSVWGQTSEVDSLLLRLDQAISHRVHYSCIRQAEIDSLQRRLSLVHSVQEQFVAYKDLFGRYSSFRMDSALWAAERCVNLASQISDSLYSFSAKMRVAEVLIGTGMYKEGLEILRDIPVGQLDTSHLFYYYNLYQKLYTHLADYAFSPRLRSTYSHLAYQYKDSILRVKRPDSQGYQLTKADKLVCDGKYNEALSILKDSYQTHLEKKYNQAIPAIALANLYGIINDRTQQKKYLAVSAIADIESGSKEYIALWKLADLLFQEGDIERAYVYMECSMQDAIFCNARYRMQEIGKMLPVVNRAYEEKLVREKKQLFISFILISVLGVILLAALVYIYVQMKRLSLAKQTVNNMNEELKAINENLRILNNKLLESNRVKEEYIGYVFNMCSTYIDKQDEFRKLLARKIKAGQIDDLYQMVHSSTFVANELKDFFKMFDSIFLKLYPNFIIDFNTLLQEGEQITPKEGELLTPELRIFALIRLGISDSGRIATFLHYSSQTVYNYRLKVRNKSAYSKEQFFELVQNIG